ncbi:MAG: DUF1349 domain-containing protein [bacterium]|nr:DUF1349 domain-containing protein [bacterium]
MQQAGAPPHGSEWLYPPPDWHDSDGVIRVRTAPKTDYWRKTHENFIAHNGHFYYQPITGDFTARVQVQGDYAAQYDQAGLMIRLDDAHWLKCGVELLDGVQQASAVLTRDFSDWSVVALPDAPAALWFELRRIGYTLYVAYSLDGERYTLIRQGYFPADDPVQVGLMCCAPSGDGFSVTFSGYTLTQP